jgi:hypothetical protein
MKLKIGIGLQYGVAKSNEVAISSIILFNGVPLFYNGEEITFTNV